VTVLKTAARKDDDAQTIIHGPITGYAQLEGRRLNSAQSSAGAAYGYAQTTRVCASQSVTLVAGGLRQIGGYRMSVLSRPSQCLTVIVVTGQSVMPRLRRSW